MNKSLILIAYLITLFFNIITCTNPKQNLDQQYCYGIILDGGSSGTVMTIFQWDCKVYQTTPDIDLQTKGSEIRKTPGISTLNDNLDGIDSYLSELYAKAKEQIPQEKWSETPIMLGATAGMRLLPQTDQENIIDRARKSLRKSGFLFHTEEWCRIITGLEEGAAMWLTVNYLLGYLRPQQMHEETATIVDIGGASTQVAFAYDVTCQESKTSISINIPQYNEYKIYAESHLFYGTDQARNVILQNSVNLQNEIYSPCFFKNFVGPWENDPEVTVKGTGNPQSCLNIINEFLKSLDEPENDENSCTTDFKMNPPDNQVVYGVSNIRHAANLFGYGESFTANQLQDDSTKLCEMEWHAVAKIYGDNIYSANSCFLGLYVASVLKNGYHIPGDKKVEAPIIIENIYPNWALGIMIYNIIMIQDQCLEHSRVQNMAYEFFNSKLYLGYFDYETA